MESSVKVNLETYKGILDQILSLVRQLFSGDLLSCAVFGSVARGEASPLSDIDLLIVHKNCERNTMSIFTDLVLKLRRTQEYKRLVAMGLYPEPFPLFIDEKKLMLRPWILLDVLDHGVILFDEDDTLKRELEKIEKRLIQLGSRKVTLADGSWYWDLKPDWKIGEVVEL